MPINIDDVRPPLGFRSSQTASLIGWPRNAQGLGELLHGVQNVLTSSTAASLNESYQRVGDEYAKRAEFDPNSVAVLPFADLSPEEDRAYFAAGVHEEILSHLAKISDLRVIARTSVARYLNTAQPIIEIADELSVAAVMEGSVRFAGDRVRVTAQLNTGKTGASLWRDTFDGEITDVFEIQSAIATEIANALHVHMNTEERASLTDHRITNITAYDCYLKARYEFGKFTPDGAQRGIALLKSGLEIDPANQLLNTALGFAYVNFGSAMLGDRVHDEALTAAEKCARQALASQPKSADGNALLGIVLFDRFDTEEGLRLMQQGAEAPDVCLEGLAWSAFCFAMCGQLHVARPWVERLKHIDPFDAFSQWTVAWYHLMEGDFDEAEYYARKAHQLDESVALYRTGLGLIVLFLNRQSEAIALLEPLHGTGPRKEVWHIVGQILYCALSGKADEARSLIDEDLKADAETDMMYAWLLADCYALLGESRLAVAWLRQAMNGGFLNYPFICYMDPLLANLPDEEEFASLMSGVRARWRSIGVLADAKFD